MNEIEKKRLAVFEHYFPMLNEVADDKGLTRDWKLVQLHGVIDEWNRALAEIEEEYA